MSARAGSDYNYRSVSRSPLESRKSERKRKRWGDVSVPEPRRRRQTRFFNGVSVYFLEEYTRLYEAVSLAYKGILYSG